MGFDRFRLFDFVPRVAHPSNKIKEMGTNMDIKTKDK
jgi:hypothetical protein